MATFALALLLLAGDQSASGSVVDVSVSFVPAKAGAPASVAVTFDPRDPDVHVNEDPWPRMKLDPGQSVLVDKQPAPTRSGSFDPAKVRSLDPAVPVLFAVALRPDAPRGKQSVKAKVTYFYCSKREGWCRKGTADVDVPVQVP